MVRNVPVVTLIFQRRVIQGAEAGAGWIYFPAFCNQDRATLSVLPSPTWTTKPSISSPFSISLVYSGCHHFWAEFSHYKQV